MRVTRRPAATLVPALVLLLLAACSGGDGEPTASPDDATEETPAAAEPTEEAEDDVAGGEGAACLEGEWEADVDVIRQTAIAAPGLETFGASAVVTGTSVTTFDGETMTTVYSAQRTEVSWAIEDQQIQTVAGYDGTLTGAYTATETEITIASVDASGLTIETASLVNGEPFDLPGVNEAVASGLAQGGTSTYTCAGDELRIQPIAEGVDTSNYVAVFHRR